MPTAALVHAAFFAVGAAVGAGTVAAVGLRRQIPSQPITDSHPIVKVSPTGVADLALTSKQPPGTVLKYGNPGTKMIEISEHYKN